MAHVPEVFVAIRSGVESEGIIVYKYGFHVTLLCTMKFVTVWCSTGYNIGLWLRASIIKKLANGG